jgi:hypothetical protein
MNESHLFAMPSIFGDWEENGFGEAPCESPQAFCEFATMVLMTKLWKQALADICLIPVRFSIDCKILHSTTVSELSEYLTTSVRLIIIILNNGF